MNKNICVFDCFYSGGSFIELTCYAPMFVPKRASKILLQGSLAKERTGCIFKIHIANVSTLEIYMVKINDILMIVPELECIHENQQSYVLCAFAKPILDVFIYTIAYLDPNLVTSETNFFCLGLHEDLEQVIHCQLFKAKRIVYSSARTIQKLLPLAIKRYQGGKVIAKAVEEAYCNPYTPLCRKRLYREFMELREQENLME